MSEKDLLPFHKGDNPEYLQVVMGFSEEKAPVQRQTDAMLEQRTQDPPRTPFVSKLPPEEPLSTPTSSLSGQPDPTYERTPEKPSSTQPDPVYERGLVAQKSLFDFVSKASKESGREYRGVFGSFRPERAIQDW